MPIFIETYYFIRLQKDLIKSSAHCNVLTSYLEIEGKVIVIISSQFYPQTLESHCISLFLF